MTTKKTARDKRREERRKRNKRNGYIAIAGILMVVVGVVGLVVWQIVRNNSLNGGLPPIPNGPGEKLADRGHLHIPQGRAAFAGSYNSVPPTSGPHWPSVLPCGIYDTPIPNEQQVHNLEHGFVVVQYKSSDPALVGQLRSIGESIPGYPNYLLMAPYPTMDSAIAITAWQRLLRMDSLDEQALRSFITTYKGIPHEQGMPTGC
ncbi:MAG: DUF3105 domain-containing protein [Dehalococcoidia bacterium]|nr:DUF3105 domain-containing protein [Dehalococcoidia bacterium]